MFRLLKIAPQAKKIILCALSTICFILFLAPLNAQVNPTPGDLRLKNTEIRQILEQRSVVNEVKFRNIGPSIMSGRVVDLEANPADPTEFYVAYATGGLWYTTNNGQSFTPVMDSLDVLFIGDISVKWNSNGNTIWVGTGEVNSSRSSYAGVGVYKTTNGGKNWEYLGLPESHHIGKIQLHPTDPNIAWIAVLGHLYSANKERGIYKTIDGGKTWKQTLFVDENTGGVDLDINPVNPNELYASMWYRVRRAWKFEESGKTGGIFKSTDGGDSWKLVSGPNSGFMSGEKIGRIGIAVYPKNPNIVYAIVDNNTIKPDTTKKVDSLYKKEDFKNITTDLFAQLKTNLIDSFLKKNFFPRKYNGKMVKEMVAAGKIPPTALFDYLDNDDGFQNAGIAGAEIYRSDDGGQTWKKANTKPLTLFSTYGYYFGKVFVSPANENKLVIVGVSVMLSIDGGKTFKNIDGANTHGDHHIVWIDPKRDNHMILGNDGGCNITYDDGAHWFFANTPPVGQYYSITTDEDKPYNVYGGLQDNNVWYGPSNFVESNRWQSSGDYPYKSIVGGDGMQVQVDTRDNTTTYAGSQFGVYSRLNRKTRVDRKSVRPSHELGEKPLRFNWQTPILLSKHNQDIFYIAANRLYRSLNRGDSLQLVSADLSNGRVPGNVPYGTITTLSESPLHFGLIYAGTDDGNVQLSKDNGYTWEKLNASAAPAVTTKKSKSAPADTKFQTNNLWVSRVIASQHKEGRVYVTLNGYRSDNFGSYLYMSDDFGKTWKQLGKDLPAEPLNVVREDPKSDSILYVGSDGGLYLSFNQGNNFMLWNGGMPRSVPVHDITIQVRENEIILGTHGRSLYVSKLDDIQQQRKDPTWIKSKMEKQKRNIAPNANVDDDEANPGHGE